MRRASGLQWSAEQLPRTTVYYRVLPRTTVCRGRAGAPGQVGRGRGSKERTEGLGLEDARIRQRGWA
eukprot:4665106-Alexandrium_andersonii.AAC.1